MALASGDRTQVGIQLMRDRECPANVTKPQLANAVSAVDDWVDANSASYAAALPAAFRNNSTADQKIMLLMYVLMKRMSRI